MARLSLLVTIAALLAVVAMGADDAAPWLELIPNPNPIVVDRALPGADALVSIELVSRATRGVKIENVTMAYLKGPGVLTTRQEGEAFFRKGALPRADRIEAGSRETWTAICLDALPSDADAVRFDVALAARRKLRLERSSQSIVVPILPAPSPSHLYPPFRGHWQVTQGHSCQSNHRLGSRGADFAWDFAALDREGSSRHSAEGASFGREVLAPVSGKVVRVVSDIEDNRGLTTYPRRSVLDDLKRPDWVYGNYIVIEHEGRYVLLGHLQMGSIQVETGARVERGAVVARVGNSGNAINAHIHMHVMDGPDPRDLAVHGIPARLTDYVEIRAATGSDAKDMLVRRVRSGDPPEGSVVAPDSEAPRRAD